MTREQIAKELLKLAVSDRDRVVARALELDGQTARFMCLLFLGAVADFLVQGAGGDGDAALAVLDGVDFTPDSALSKEHVKPARRPPKSGKSAPGPARKPSKAAANRT